nr:MAG TPA: YopX protein [Caudoviricetes sp.]
MIPKFRAWDKETKTMNGMAEIYRNRSQEIKLRPRDENIILMQSTGLFDKNDKEIFEGDILFGHAGEDFWEIVEFDIEEGKWIRRDIWYNSKLDLSENNEFMEIVGNIYENKEFLEVTK